MEHERAEGLFVESFRESDPEALAAAVGEWLEKNPSYAVVDVKYASCATGEEGDIEWDYSLLIFYRVGKQ